MPDMKRYLGDGVYVDYDGYSLVLTASDGLIVLEPDVFQALLDYADMLRLEGAARAARTDPPTPE